LEQADVERLPFVDASFDTVTATCVFCSVEHPVRGLEEVRRVTKPSGQVLLLEHVRPRNPLLGRLSDLLSPLTRRFGPEINRRTEENIRKAGLDIVSVRRDGVWREIVARPGKQAA
jgi:ubiquinone/menaquinone biosynthesis C-methylase UbiE